MDEHPAALASGPPHDSAVGLTEAEAQRRRARYGPNVLELERPSLFKKLVPFVWGPIPWMIEAAALLSALGRRWEDFGLVLFMLFVNAGVGFWQEHKADTAVEALKKHLALRARVLRDGVWRERDAADLVPGDVVLVRLGNIVPADLLLEGEGYVTVDESALTGESLPVEKKGQDPLYSGSIVRTGEMSGVVTAVGDQTFFGRTARLVEQAETRSHFQKAVLRIGDFLILLTAALVAVLLVAAFFRGEPILDVVMFVLVLVIAAIPVALPAVLSVTMAVGAGRLAALKAIVSRLVSIEELAGMDVLCSDKTGTLTRNELSVGEPVVVSARNAQEVDTWAALASRPADGDPIDVAVAAAAPPGGEGGTFQVVGFEPFDPVRKRTEAEVRGPGGRWSVAKGAPQAILDLAGVAGPAKAALEGEVDRLAGRGYRTLAVARRRGGAPWEVLGLLPLFDPPRADAASTVRAARAMGLDVRMVTGDHAAIARETARQLGLGDRIVSADEARRADPELIASASVFAQVFPEHKFAIVRALQDMGHIVGMTGDGVNDAPALKQADVGIAVSGATDAARAAADLVLTAPGLGVITRAVEEARRIFERMTSYAVFRIAETVRVLLFMSLSILLFGFYPVTPVMIVLLAVLNDVPIMTIAYDHVPVAPAPVRWNMGWVLSMASLLGGLGLVSSFGLFWFVRDVLRLPDETVRTLLFLKLLVAGHLTIYLTRTRGPFWSRPWPAGVLLGATEGTQLLGTLAAVYGWFVPPIGWSRALAVWGYALAWLVLNNFVKLAFSRVLERRALGPAGGPSGDPARTPPGR